jgi:hypothetical protein
MEVIPDHLAVTAKAARAGTVLFQKEPGVLPITAQDTRRITLVEFASLLDSEALEQGGKTSLAALLHEQCPHIESVGLNSTDPAPEALNHARELAASANVLIVATRNMDSTQISPEF